MAEPTSMTAGAGGAALIAIAASMVGSRYGPVVTIITAAAIGAFVSLGEVASTTSRVQAVRYLFTYILAAAMTAGTVSYLLERMTGVPAVEILALVAFCIGWIGGRWTGLLNAALSAAQKLISTRR